MRSLRDVAASLGMLRRRSGKSSGGSVANGAADWIAPKSVGWPGRRASPYSFTATNPAVWAASCD